MCKKEREETGHTELERGVVLELKAQLLIAVRLEEIPMERGSTEC